MLCHFLRRKDRCGYLLAIASGYKYTNGIRISLKKKPVGKKGIRLVTLYGSIEKLVISLPESILTTYIFEGRDHRFKPYYYHVVLVSLKDR